MLSRVQPAASNASSKAEVFMPFFRHVRAGPSSAPYSANAIWT